MPIFGNLKPYLEEAFELAEAGEVFVVGGPQGNGYREASHGPNGWVNANLRTLFSKLIRRAGLKQWPKLFHNLRASCENDLLEQFPITAVTEWLGHSAAIAIKHYSRVPEHLYAKAAEFGIRRTESGTVMAQNAAQSEADLNDRKRTKATDTLLNKGFCRVLVASDSLCSNAMMNDTGLEPSCQSPINYEGSAHSDSGRGAQSDVIDPLAAFVAVLTPEQRAALAKLLAGAT